MPRLLHFYVYILASLSGTLYVGLTDDLKKRIEEHRLGLVDSFTKKYKVNRPCITKYSVMQMWLRAEKNRLRNIVVKRRLLYLLRATRVGKI